MLSGCWKIFRMVSTLKRWFGLPVTLSMVSNEMGDRSRITSWYVTSISGHLSQWQLSVAGKVTVGLALHWPCVRLIGLRLRTPLRLCESMAPFLHTEGVWPKVDTITHGQEDMLSLSANNLYTVFLNDSFQHARDACSSIDKYISYTVLKCNISLCNSCS